MKKENNDLGYCPDCHKEHGCTVIELKPHCEYKSNGFKYEQYYIVCSVCGKRELKKRRITRRFIDSGFNYEDYKFDINNYEE